jgi:hypothetical protein
MVNVENASYACLVIWICSFCETAILDFSYGNLIDSVVENEKWSWDWFVNSSLDELCVVLLAGTQNLRTPLKT